MDVLRRDGFVEDDSLEFTILRGRNGRIDQVRLDGNVFCSDGVAVEVTKFMDTRELEGRLEVLSTYYRYHAWRPRHGGQSLIRYDQSHGYPHYHRFDRDGNTERHDELTLDTMPRLDAVIREAVELSRAWDAESGATVSLT